MLDPKFFDNLAKQLSSKIPTQVHALRSEIESNLKNTLQAIFSKLDLVTREEFDVQARLLERARERIIALEDKIKAYEKDKSLDNSSEK
ncbi:MAG: accessory factor UbiK family protein [Gammaproteobacteria bacterium]|nr:accessory factor UbiK family protein [Gammaproteobacteria bacterium]